MKRGTKKTKDALKRTHTRMHCSCGWIKKLICVDNFHFECIFFVEHGGFGVLELGGILTQAWENIVPTEIVSNILKKYIFIYAQMNVNKLNCVRFSALNSRHRFLLVSVNFKKKNKKKVIWTSIVLFSCDKKNFGKLKKERQNVLTSFKCIYWS